MEKYYLSGSAEGGIFIRRFDTAKGLLGYIHEEIAVSERDFLPIFLEELPYELCYGSLTSKICRKI